MTTLEADRVSDASLLEAYVRRRDADAFAELVRRHAGLVYAAAKRVARDAHDAEDVTQACFLELAQKAGGVRTCVAGWLHTAATRRATDAVRSKASRRRHERDRVPPAGEATWDELAPLIDAAIAALPEKLRAPLVMHYLEAMPQDAVARELGVDQSTVSRRLGSAIERLRRTLGVAMPAAALGAMLTQQAAGAAPASVVAAATTVGLAGVAPAVSGAGAGWLTLSALGAVAAAVVAVIWLGPAATPPPTATPLAPTTAGTPMTAADNAVVQREAGSVWIEGVPRLEWGKSGETTFAGALSAALQPIGPRRDYGTLMGHTATAFRARWYHGPADRRWSGGAAVGEQVEERTRAAAAIGRSLDVRWSYPSGADRSETIAAIAASIDAGRPVLAYLSPALDVAVVYGYADAGSTVLVRDYYDRPETDPRRPASRLGGFFIFLGDAAAVPPTERDNCIAGLRGALHNWTRRDRPSFDEDGGEFIYGDAAYEEWIADLRGVEDLAPEERQLLFEVSNWVLNCTNDARWAASRYLQAMAPQFDGEARAALARAAELYVQFGGATGGPTWGERAVFLGPWSGKTIAAWTPEVRAREMRILEQARQLDAQAIRHIALALASLLPADQVAAFLQDVRRNDLPAMRAKLDATPELAWAATSEGTTALMAAAGEGRVEALGLLLDRGAELEAIDHLYGDTALGWAAFYGQADTARLLLDRRANIGHKLKDGGSILGITVEGERGRWSEWSSATPDQYRAVAELLRERGAAD